MAKRHYDLVGVDGNAFSVMGYVRKAMRQCGKKSDEIEAYTKDAMSSDYNHLLVVSCEMVDKLNAENGTDSDEYDNLEEPGM